ncbi:methyltransferase domain-containing protein [Desulfovibrio aerotolerans]|uniref:Methyltransferase domain-containing protein n=1 Tax=Solidesulfovibrio aerotolerans TaxID=295255 RepID=A0A7C9MKX6_9BACT|nr:methyltransferase domain-containing protein [Solidesulfovibrio aerotolerans]
MLRLLNLGCGRAYHPDWVNLDFTPCPPHVLGYDLSQGIPFPDGLFDVVYHSHVLEHFSQVDATRFLRECLRVFRTWWRTEWLADSPPRGILRPWRNLSLSCATCRPRKPSGCGCAAVRPSWPGSPSCTRRGLTRNFMNRCLYRIGTSACEDQIPATGMDNANSNR